MDRSFIWRKGDWGGYFGLLANNPAHLGGAIAILTGIVLLVRWHPAPPATESPELIDEFGAVASSEPYNQDLDVAEPVIPVGAEAELSALDLRPVLDGVGSHTDYAFAARLRVACAALALFGLAISLWTFRTARMSFPYLDVSWATQVGALGDHDDDFGGVKTNAMTYEAVGDLQECRKKYPTKWVFVGPENAFLYPLLDLRNPLPLDLFTPAEFKGQEKQIVAMAKERAKDTGLLLLAQYSPNKDLETQTKLPEATPGGANIMDSAGPPTQDVWNAFPGGEGQLVACGPFVGKYIK